MTKLISLRFEALSEWFSVSLGSPYAFILACVLVVAWAMTGPLFSYSDTWQLVINTGTTICTFLMVFLLQNTGNRTIEEMQQRLSQLERANRELLDEIRRSGIGGSGLAEHCSDIGLGPAGAAPPVRFPH